MPKEFPRLKVGDELEINHLNICYREFERWQKLHATGGIGVDNAETNDAPVIVDYRIKAMLPAQLTSGIAAGSIGSPASAAGTLLIPSGATGGFTATGGTAVTIYSTYPTAVSGSNVFCWVTYAFGLYYLTVAAC